MHSIDKSSKITVQGYGDYRFITMNFYRNDTVADISKKLSSIGIGLMLCWRENRLTILPR